MVQMVHIMLMQVRRILIILVHQVEVLIIGLEYAQLLGFNDF